MALHVVYSAPRGLANLWVLLALYWVAPIAEVLVFLWSVYSPVWASFIYGSNVCVILGGECNRVLYLLNYNYTFAFVFLSIT